MSDTNTVPGTDGKPANPAGNRLLAHRRQLVIAGNMFDFGEGWRTETIGDGLVLSTHEDLVIERVEIGGRNVLILGNSLRLPGDRPATLPGDLRAGRFGWLDWPYLYPDAGSLLPIYYGTTPAGPIVTSSPALARLAGAAHSDGRDIQWRGLNWTPPPGSVGGGVKKLLRDQRLHLPSLRVEAVPAPIEPVGSFDEARDSLIQTLTGTLRGLGERDGSLHLALTAGIDSRTLLAAAVALDLKFDTVTMEFESIKRADLTVAAELSRYLGIRHVISGPMPPDVSRLDIWRAHTASSYADSADAFLVAQGQYRFLEPGCTLIRGGCFELGRRFFKHRFAGLRLETVTGEDLWYRSEKRPPDPRTVEYLDAWLEWRREHPTGLDLVDAYYLDQRVGGWLSAVEHGMDIYPGVSMVPGNCNAVFSALITPDERARQLGLLQRAAIAAMAPRLARFPINPQSLPGRVRAANLSAKRALKHFLRRVLPRDTQGPLRGYLDR